MVDPDKHETRYAYHPRGWLEQVTESGAWETVYKSTTRTAGSVRAGDIGTGAARSVIGSETSGPGRDRRTDLVKLNPYRYSGYRYDRETLRGGPL